MRIAFVTDTYEDGISGGAVTGVRFVEALRRHHEVTVLATGAPAPGKIQLPGFQLPLRAMRENRITFGWPSRSILEPVFAGVDLVHVQFPFYLGFGATTVAAIYKERWQIELFFKALKGNLRIKSFVGTSKNALYTQIWTALIAILMLKIMALRSKLGWSLSTLAAMLRWNLFSHRDLWDWVDNPYGPPPDEATWEHPSLFDNALGQHLAFSSRGASS